MAQINADIIIGGNGENIGFGEFAAGLHDAGYTFGGEITPTSTPSQTEQSLFFVAMTAGTYTNYGGIVVAAGEIAFIYKENGSWVKVSKTLVNPFKGWFEAGATETSNLPANPSVGDYAYVMTVDGNDNPITKVYDCVAAGVWHDSGRDVDTSNVQTFATGEKVNEVGIDDEPTAESDNLVKSGGVYNSTPSLANSSTESDLEISDEQGNVLVRFANGHIKVKNFDSADAATQSEIEVGDSSDADLDISDEQGNVLVRFANGHIKVKNFDSADNQSEIQDINSDIQDIRDQIGSTTTERIGNTFSSVRKQSTVVFDNEGVGVIFEASGRGCIENMFFAGDASNWHNPESCVLDVYCDDVLCLSGKLYELSSMCLDFATHENYETIHLETALFAKLGNKNSINLNFKIPYYSSCRVTLTQPTAGVSDMVWATVIARDVIDINYGGIKIPNNAYFKGIRQSNQTISNGDFYTIMDCNKQHCVVIGINLFLNGNSNNYSLEGCFRAYNKDNNTYYYLSSGTEDFFLGTYYFDSRLYQRYNVGLTYFNSGKLAAYRQFTDSPICFSHHTSKITVRNGDCVILNGETPGYPSAPIYTASDAVYGGFCFYYEW